jgi:ParB/RepB/Spo0J family partition protein
LSQPQTEVAQVVPSGELKRLKPEEIIPSKTNPRHLFDRPELDELKNSIRQHGVLVPITVYRPKGQKKYSILDGERRYRCCIELKTEGIDIDLPANVVVPPTKIAGLLYMFSIHNFREDWELMPTALGLRIVMEELEESDNKVLCKLTGLSERQIERCKILLEFPERFQNLSLDPDPKTRIPSNFWIEAYPVLNLCEKVLPDLAVQYKRDGLTDKLVEKYRAKKIKSVIHFRRIMEAYEVAEGDPQQREAVVKRLRDYILNIQLETRAAFDEFVVDNRRIQSALKACETYLNQLQRAKLSYAAEEIDRKLLIQALQEVKNYVEQLLQKLAGGDAPIDETSETEADGDED